MHKRDSLHRGCRLLLIAWLCQVMLLGPAVNVLQAQDRVYPKHVNDAVLLAVRDGLAYLAKTQDDTGGWTGSSDGANYPISMAALAGMAFLAGGNTPTRGPYASNVRRVLAFLMRNVQSNGLITGPGQEQGRPMYGHGFTTMFFACVHGMETRDHVRRQLDEIIPKAIDLIARAQSPAGGWNYQPASGDEGSVTVTQMQALRAAHQAGFVVPQTVIDKAVQYLENCRTPEGGIRYSLSSGNQTRLPISAAAVATLYNAGEYDSDLAGACLKLIYDRYRTAGSRGWDFAGGHDYYTHLYASQAFYQAGDTYWDAYYPAIAAKIVSMRQSDGSWQGDVGPVFGTSVALIVLQLPFRFLPIYQR